MVRRGYKQSPEHIRNRIPVPLPKETIEKQVSGRLRYYENNEVWNKGKRHSKATRLKISKSMKRYWKQRKNKE